MKDTGQSLGWIIDMEKADILAMRFSGKLNPSFKPDVYFHHAIEAKMREAVADYVEHGTCQIKGGFKSGKA